jgi:hypothetical protein
MQRRLARYREPRQFRERVPKPIMSPLDASANQEYELPDAERQVHSERLSYAPASRAGSSANRWRLSAWWRPSWCWSIHASARLVLGATDKANRFPKLTCMVRAAYLNTGGLKVTGSLLHPRPVNREFSRLGLTCKCCQFPVRLTLDSQRR